MSGYRYLEILVTKLIDADCSQYINIKVKNPKALFGIPFRKKSFFSYFHYDAEEEFQEQIKEEEIFRAQYEVQDLVSYLVDVKYGAEDFH